MGNAASNGQTRQQRQQAWGWEFKDGRAQIKPRQGGGQAGSRPLFKKQPSDNYDWWIFNPDPPKRSNSRNRRAR